MHYRTNDVLLRVARTEDTQRTPRGEPYVACRSPTRYAATTSTTATATIRCSSETVAPGVGVKNESPDHTAAPLGQYLGLRSGDADLSAGHLIPTWTTSPLGRICASGGSTRPCRSDTPGRGQERTERRARSLDQLRHRRGIRSEHGDAVNHFDVGRRTRGRLPMLAAAGRELGHQNTHHEDGDCRLEVGAMADGESIVGTREKEVEPERRRHAGDDPGEPIAARGDREYRDHHHEGCGGASERAAKWDQHCGHDQRQDDTGREAQPTAVPLNRVITVASSSCPVYT